MLTLKFPAIRFLCGLLLFSAVMVLSACESRNIVLPKDVKTVTEGLEFEMVDKFIGGTAKVVKEGLNGFVDTNGELTIILDENITVHGNFSEGFVSFLDAETGKMGFIDESGKIVIAPVFSQVGDFHEGLAWVRDIVDIGGDSSTFYALQSGFIDTAGKIVIPPEYDIAGNFCNGTAIVTKLSLINGQWVQVNKLGCIDKAGKIIIPFEYDYLAAFYEGVAPARKNGKCCLVDEMSGDVVRQLEYDDVKDFSEGLAAVSKNGKWGYIDVNGNELIPPAYDNAYGFHEGYAMVQLFSCDSDETHDSRTKTLLSGFIDKDGNIAVPVEQCELSLQSDRIWGFYDGLIRLYIDGKFGYADAFGNVCVPFEYENASLCFSDGLAAVCMDGKWGYVNKLGEVVVQLEYDYAYDFTEGLAWVKKDGKWGILEITIE